MSRPPRASKSPMPERISRRTALLASLLAGCSSKGGANGAAEVPPATPAEVARFAAASNAFSADLYGKLGASSGNFVYAPASLSTALAMTWMGARGETREQMTQVLHFGGTDPGALASLAARVLVALGDPSRVGALSFANRLFGDASCRFDGDFLDVTKDQFGAELERLDFAGAGERARDTINEWVAARTHDRIKNVLPPGSIGPLLRLVLVNALHLRCQWASPFPRESAGGRPFRVDAGRTLDVAMMCTEVGAPCGVVDGVRIIDVPYEGEQLSMTLLLPADGSSMADLEAKIGAGQLDAMVSALRHTRVWLTMPKFKIDPATPTDLREVLAALGMPLAFTGGADFGGMVERDASSLHLENLFHKAFVSVDEYGTEAAAASAATQFAVSLIGTFVVDSPFVFALRDRKSGLVLFQGRVMEP